MPKFPSKEWAEEYCKVLNSHEPYKKAARGWQWPILFKVRDLPEELRKEYPSGEPGFLINLKDGDCLGVEWYDDASNADAPFIISASYKDWIEIITGKLNPLTAIIRGRLKIEKGDYKTIMRFPIAALEMVEAAKRVGVE